MTKLRPPLSIDAALARIAGQLQNGWTEMAAIAERSETTVRHWGDPDRPEQIPLPLAIRLDIAFADAGGEGQPLFETYALLVQVERQKAFADHVALQLRACELIREAGQAVEAIVLAGMPGAGHRERETAAREVKDVSDLIPSTLGMLSGSARAPP